MKATHRIVRVNEADARHRLNNRMKGKEGTFKQIIPTIDGHECGQFTFIPPFDLYGDGTKLSTITCLSIVLEELKQDDV